MAKASAAKAVSKDLESAPLGPVPAGSEMDIPVDLIVADEKFNARKDLSGSTEEGHDIAGLALSIKKDGQLSPVLVATLKEYPGKYFLVYGYRRFMAISLPTDKGGLGLKTIRATVYQQPKGKEITKADLLYINLIENEARKNLNPYERATRYHELVKEHGESGNQIAKRVSLDPSYVNRLVASMEMHPRVIERFKEEHSPDFKGTRILTTDTINKLTRMKKEDGTQNHEEQIAWLDKFLNPQPEPDTDPDNPDDNDDDDIKVTRASMSQLKKALAAAKAALKSATKSDKDTIEGVIKGLEFAIKPRKIEGVLTLKDDGKTIIGHDGKQVAAPKK